MPRKPDFTPFLKIIDNVYPSGYNITMYEIRKTDAYALWLDGLRDIHARAF
jgi:hypothetical protein